MVTIDREKCTACGICVDVCPAAAFAVRSANGRREVFARYPGDCVSCGHCMAACSPMAIVHPELSYGDFEELEEIDISPESMKNLMFSRRSVRSYRDETPPAELIDGLIEVAAHAGSGSNQQSVGFLVINDRELIRELERAVIRILKALLKPFGTNALLPLLRVVYGPEMVEGGMLYLDYLVRREEDNELEGLVFFNAPTLLLAHDMRPNPEISAINCAIAMRNIEITALTMGLGTCWNGFLLLAAGKKAKVINGLLGLDNSRRIRGALMVGYPRHRSKYKIPRREREVIRL